MIPTHAFNLASSASRVVNRASATAPWAFPPSLDPPSHVYKPKSTSVAPKATVTLNGESLIASVDGVSHEIIGGLAPTLHVGVPEQHEGVFVDFVGATSRADHTISLGELHCERLLAAARTKRWWMGPAFGAAASDVPAETQFLLLELAPDAYAVVLPLVSGAFRATLRGSDHGGGTHMEVQLQSGDPDVHSDTMSNMMFVAAGNDPYALLDSAMGAVSTRLGSFEVASAKATPPELDEFGWCTWDAFYSAVDPSGVTAGLQSLSAGGTPARLLILDDGWQSVAQEGPRRYALKPQEAAGDDAEDGVRVHRRERPEEAVDGEEQAAAENDDDHTNNPIHMKGFNVLQDLVSDYYRRLVDPAPLGSLHARLWRLAAHTVVKPALEQMFDEQTDFSKRLFAFAANDKFEDAARGTSLRERVAEWKGQYGLRSVYAWHTIGGYWGGVSTVAAGMEHLRPTETLPTPTRPLLEVEPALGWDAAAIFGVGNVHPDHLGDFYDGLHGYLNDAGVDGVKVDGQSGLTAFGVGRGGTSRMVRAHVHAMEASVRRHFGADTNRCINCMCHSTDNLYSYRSTALVRAADDFYPDDAASQPVHLANVVYNSLFLSPIGVPDWDMFRTDHADAGMHAAARAVSGGQVYVSDAPGAHDFDLLRTLVLPDGRTLRCASAGRPTRDCLFSDPNVDGVSALKVWNRNPVTGVVAAFNVQGARWNREARRFEEVEGGPVEVTARVRVDDVEGMSEPQGGPPADGASATHVLFGHRAQVPVPVRRGGEAHELRLPTRGWEVFAVAPIARHRGVSWAPLGLVRMINGGGALVSSGLGGGGEGGEGGDSVSARVALKAAGEFGAVCQPRPRTVRVGTEALAFSHDAASGMLRVDVPGATASAEAPAELIVEF